MDIDVILKGSLGTLSLWLNSALLAFGFAFLFAGGIVKGHRFIACLCTCGVNLTRGIPTSILVLAAGIGLMHLLPAYDMPVIFPGTLTLFQPLAWAIAIALALGSAGHLAEIFLAARNTVGRVRIEQMHALGLSPTRRTRLLCRECAAVALPAVTTRLIHHLHNTAFAALFPVVELFGTVQSQANTTFRVFDAVLVGAAAYVVMSGAIWLLGRLAETRLKPTQARLDFFRSPSHGRP